MLAALFATKVDSVFQETQTNTRLHIPSHQQQHNKHYLHFLDTHLQQYYPYTVVSYTQSTTKTKQPHTIYLLNIHKIQ